MVSSRYEPLLKIASGGMATVYVGRLRGAAGFSRAVAIKRAHPHIAADQDFRRLFVAEARLASRIHHPNVVGVLDVEESDERELSLVMDYVEGASLAEVLNDLAKRGEVLEPRVAVRIVLDACAGLHHAHDLEDDDGRPLRLVHRDVSPQNVLLGLDGVARIADFGIAKSAAEATLTSTGVLRGKAAYMAPEYVNHVKADRRADVFALAIVAWESLTGQRLFKGKSEPDTLRRITSHEAAPMASVRRGLAALDPPIGRALTKDPDARTPTAAALAEELEAAARPAGLVATHAEVAAVVRAVAGPRVAERRRALRAAAEPPTERDLPAVPAEEPSAEEISAVPEPSGTPLREAATAPVVLPDPGRRSPSDPPVVEVATASHAAAEVDPLGEFPTVIRPNQPSHADLGAAPPASEPAAGKAALRRTVPLAPHRAALTPPEATDGSTAPTLVRDLTATAKPLAVTSASAPAPRPRRPWGLAAVVAAATGLAVALALGLGRSGDAPRPPMVAAPTITATAGASAGPATVEPRPTAGADAPPAAPEPPPPATAEPSAAARPEPPVPPAAHGDGAPVGEREAPPKVGDQRDRPLRAVMICCAGDVGPLEPLAAPGWGGQAGEGRFLPQRSGG